MFSRGDFPAFYAAGVIAASEHPADMYSLAEQANVQFKHWPQMKGEVLAFSYPPYVAQFFSLMRGIPGPQAKLIFSVLMFALLLQSLRILCKMRSELEKFKIELLALSLSCAPLAAGLVSGQNVGFSIFLLVCGFYFLSRKNQFGLGISFGLLMFKPHYGAIALASLLASRNYKAFGVGILVSSLLYLCSALLLGFDWPIFWFEAVRVFAEADAGANNHQMISLIGVISAAQPNFLGLAYFLTAVSLIFYLYTVFVRQDRDLFLIATLGPLMVFLSPHSLFYDLGISLIGLPLLLRFKRDFQISLLVLAWVIGFLLVLLKADFSIQPLFLVSPLLLILSWRGDLCLSHLNFSGRGAK